MIFATRGNCMKLNKICIGLCSLIAFMPAYASSNFDNLLYQNGIVNEEYEFIDYKIAAEFFREASDLWSYSYPMRLNSEMEISSVYFTPYNVIYFVNLNIDLDEHEISLISDDLVTNKDILDMCNDYYYEFKYMVKNNVSNTFLYKDLSGDTIAEITLDNDSCIKALANKWFK